MTWLTSLEEAPATGVGDVVLPPKTGAVVRRAEEESCRDGGEDEDVAEECGEAPLSLAEDSPLSEISSSGAEWRPLTPDAMAAAAARFSSASE